jgi:hypothetical protein
MSTSDHVSAPASLYRVGDLVRVRLNSAACRSEAAGRVTGTTATTVHVQLLAETVVTIEHVGQRTRQTSRLRVPHVRMTARSIINAAGNVERVPVPVGIFRWQRYHRRYYCEELNDYIVGPFNADETLVYLG